MVEFSTSVFTPFSGIVEILEIELGTKDVSTAVTLDDRLPLMLFVLLVLLLLLLLLLDTLTLGTDVTKVLLLLLMMVDETDNGVGATDDGMVVGAGAMLDDDTSDILGEDDTDEDEVIDGGAGTADEGVALRDKLAFVGAAAVLAVDTVAVVEVVVIVGTVVLFSVTGAPGPD